MPCDPVLHGVHTDDAFNAYEPAVQSVCADTPDAHEYPTLHVTHADDAFNE